jgi:hypothetical protein
MTSFSVDLDLSRSCNLKAEDNVTADVAVVDEHVWEYDIGLGNFVLKSCPRGKLHKYV